MVGADLKRLVEQELDAYGGGEGRVTISGFRLALGPESAQPLAMSIHELATNAANYGALSVAGAWLSNGHGPRMAGWSCAGRRPAVRRCASRRARVSAPN